MAEQIILLGGPADLTRVILPDATATYKVPTMDLSYRRLLWSHPADQAFDVNVKCAEYRKIGHRHDPTTGTLVEHIYAYEVTR